jgi:N-acetylglutamate synthase-like GNAT family acetyltransferase
MDEIRIRAATAADVPAIVDTVDRAYRHYIVRIGKPPGPMLDDYAARVSEDAVWVLQDGPAIAGILVLLSAPEYLLLDNIAIAPELQGRGLGRRLLARKAKLCGAVIARSGSTRTRR